MHLSALQYQMEVRLMSSEKGQTLLELVVAITVAVLVLGSLVFATITSLRNAQLAKNQAQATKLAQEGLEDIRTLRDRNGGIVYNGINIEFSDLWGIGFSCPGNCYFFFNSSGVLISSASFENIPPNFKRQILIEGGTSDSKQITAIVQWDDLFGTHQSKLTTILRNTQ